MCKRFLVIGYGSMGQRHASLIAELFPHAEITILRHQHDDRLPPARSCYVYSIDEALAHNPDVAVIANPASLHLNYAVDLAKAGVHMLIEKPLSDGSSGISGLIAMCEPTDLVLMPGYNLRFCESLCEFKRIIDSEQLGHLCSVRSQVGQYLPTWRPGKDYRESVSAKRALGGGPLLELSHEIDYLSWLFGDIRWVISVAGHFSTLDVDTEDTVFMIMGLGGKSNREVLACSLNMDFTRHDKVRSCDVIGERGTLRWNAIEGTVSLYGSDSQKWEVIYKNAASVQDSYRSEWAHFMDCIDNRVQPKISAYDALHVLHVVEAARLSNQKRMSIEVEEVYRHGWHK